MSIVPPVKSVIALARRQQGAFDGGRHGGGEIAQRLARRLTAGMGRRIQHDERRVVPLSAEPETPATACRRTDSR